MAYASNGAAIIRGLVVPASEMKVLRTLVQLGLPVIVPAIATAMRDKMSDASIYSLLSRMDGRGGLVKREVVEVNVHGTKLRRVLWSAQEEVTDFFDSLGLLSDSEVRRAQEPAGATG